MTIAKEKGRASELAGMGPEPAGKGAELAGITSEPGRLEGKGGEKKKNGAFLVFVSTIHYRLLHSTGPLPKNHWSKGNR